MRRTCFCLTVGVAALTVQPPIRAQDGAADLLIEYPGADREEAGLVARAQHASRMAGWLADDPFHPSAASALFHGRYLAATMRHLPRLPDEPPARILHVLRAMADAFNEIRLGEPRDYPVVAKQVLSQIRTRLPGFPREAAASIAWEVLRLDLLLGDDIRAPNASDVARFVAQYAGTEAARRAESPPGKETAASPQTAARVDSVGVDADAAARRALATLASDAFRARDEERARVAYGEYLARFPETPWSWLAAIRLGETFERMGNRDAAANAYQHPAIAAADPVVRAIAGARAGAAFDRLGLFEDALESYRRALAAAETARLPVTSYEVRRGALTSRIAEIEQSRRAPRGDLIERGRIALTARQAARARAALEEFFATSPPPSAATAEARVLLHRAMLEQALPLAAPGRPPQDAAAAMAILDRLAAEPPDFFVGAAGVARAALLWRVGRTQDATVQMAAALDRLVAVEGAANLMAETTEIAQEASAIDAMLFRPAREIEGLGNAGRLPLVTVRASPVMLLLDRSVTQATGEETYARIRRAYPGVRWVLYLTYAQYYTLRNVIDTAGRIKPRTLVMTSPADSDPDDGPPFWERFFPPAAGIVCDACISPGSIEFLDAERTRALVGVSFGSSGQTWLVLNKVNGRWQVVRLANVMMMA